MIELLSINIGKAQSIATKSGQSGIFKTPQSNDVEIGTLGLAGDTIIDTKHHGGIDQAVYIYFQPDYDWWTKELGREMPIGIFGENLTISELKSQDMLVGDQFEIGNVLLEITSPRIPCVTLARRMGDKQFPKKFMASDRPGVYCRVLKTGAVHASMAVKHIPFQGPQVPVNLMVKNFIQPDPSLNELFLSVPVHYKTRQELTPKS